MDEDNDSNPKYVPYVENRYVFSDSIFDKDKDKIRSLIGENSHTRNEEKNTITLIIMGHGSERYKENFKKVIEYDNYYYSKFFTNKVLEQKTKKSIRILSKVGIPKICGWDYQLCTKQMSSQDMILQLSRIFFTQDNNGKTTSKLLKSMSLYFKELYPKIIEKISKNYRDLPEDKNSGSPDAENYSENYANFNKVQDSITKNRFSEIKALSHEKTFNVRPEAVEVYSLHCEKYLFEIVEYRTEETDEFTNFIFNYLKIQNNLTKNYYSMSHTEINEYIHDYTKSVNYFLYLDILPEEKFYLNNFMFKLYFGNDLKLSEIIEFFVILRVDTINIIDNTCRMEDRNGLEHIRTPRTSEIELDERLSSKSKSRSRSRSSSSKSGGIRISKKTRKNKK